jgi:hypothetical protein
MALVGIWYLAAGLISLAYSNSLQAFSPWSMGLAFGVGQGLVAALLQQSLGGIDERA